MPNRSLLEIVYSELILTPLLCLGRQAAINHQTFMQFFVKPNPFLKLLSFRVIIVLAYQIMAIVVGWHIYELTHDTLALGLVGLAEVVPYFCCALFAGYAVDHHSRRMFGVFACLMLFLTALTLTAVAAGWIGGNPALWIYGSIAFTGVARAFIGPSYSAMFALVLQREHYASCLLYTSRRG